MQITQEDYEKEGVFEELPPGIYKVVASVNSKDGKAKNSDKEQLTLELDVISAENGDVTHRGKKVWHRITEGEKQGSFLAAAMKGFNVPFPANGQVKAMLFMGQTATVEIVKNGDFTNVKKFIIKDKHEQVTTNQSEITY